MADAHALLHEAFRDERDNLDRDYGLSTLIDAMTESDAQAFGRAAARRAYAPLVWRAVAGDALDTTAVRKMLGVSRQALAERVERGTALGLPGERTTLYPVWQFDGADIRPVIADIIAAFRDALGDDVDPLIVVSWADAPQPELDGATPAAWVAEGRDEKPVIVAAERTAQTLRR